MAVPPKNAGREFQRAVLAHRATLDRLLDRRSILGLRRYFNQAQDKLESMLGRMAKGARGEPLAASQAQLLLQTVRQAQQEIAKRLAARLRPVLVEAQGEGIDQVEETMVEMEDKSHGALLALGLSELTTKSKLQEQRASVLERINETAWGAFAAAVAVGMSESLAMSLAMREEPLVAVERLRAAADKGWWRAERIVHTEMAYAYNQAQADAISEVAGGIKGLGKRWCELVDDATGLPMDNRVGNDSIVLHGQVVEASGLFVMPEDPIVHPSFWNRTWSSSPNRPNDRSVTMPWRQEWGVPGYRLVNGARVPVNQAG